MADGSTSIDYPIATFGQMPFRYERNFLKRSARSAAIASNRVQWGARMKMVTLYRENRRDQAHQCSPDELAADFVATLRGERYPDYRPSGSCRIDD